MDKGNNKFDVLTGQALLYFRNKCGMTQSEVSKRLNKSRPWLTSIENGNRSIYWEDMKSICVIYGISPSDVSRKIDELE